MMNFITTSTEGKVIFEGRNLISQKIYDMKLSTVELREV